MLFSDDTAKVKPIFHCDAKTLTLGCRVGQYPQHESFALGIPTCWCLGVKGVSLKFTGGYPRKCPRNAKIPGCITPNANRWNIGRVGSPMQNSCVGHVDFMLFSVTLICVG